MTAPTFKMPVPEWLMDAVAGLVMSAYEAGYAQAAKQEPIPAPPPDVLDRTEAAAFLRCGKTKLDQLVQRQHDPVPSFLIEGRRLFRRVELEWWIVRQTGRPE